MIHRLRRTLAFLIVLALPSTAFAEFREMQLAVRGMD